MGDYDEAGRTSVSRPPLGWFIVGIAVIVASAAVVLGVVEFANSDSSGSSDAEAATRQLLRNDLTRVGYLDADISDVRCVDVSGKENQYRCVATALFYGNPKTVTGTLRCEGTTSAYTCSWRGKFPRSYS